MFHKLKTIVEKQALSLCGRILFLNARVQKLNISWSVKLWIILAFINKMTLGINLREKISLVVSK